MNRWTESAQAQLNEYSAKVRRELEQSGVDANEVAEDLRRHVHEEVEAEKLPLVTAQDVSRIIARIGTPKVESSSEAQGSQLGPFPSNGSATTEFKKPGVLQLLFGILLPLGVIIFEYLSGACAGVLFDPAPTIGHWILLLIVPAANLGSWLMVRRGETRWLARLAWANGLALGVSFVYALLFLPFSPFALIGIIFYGFGMIPLTPVIAFGCTILMRTHLRAAAGENNPLPGLWRGGAVGIALLLLCTLPLLLTSKGLRMAASESETERTQGVRLLRALGQREEILRACYGRSSNPGQIIPFRGQISAEMARETYYRVYGRAFNSVPPPKLYSGKVRWSLLEEEFTWDNDQGGEAVAGRIKGLSLASSRQDGFIDPAAAVSYVEWTLEFKNISALQREARAQVLLPPGGVVSRVTLWINGEEREAAFGGRSQVKEAYKNVVQQRRDPVMVTTCGPDRVLVQCFPIAPRGGKMKVRLGITAPLTLEATDRGLLRAPCFIERNFTISQEFQHSLWIESKGTMKAAGLHEDNSGSRHALRGDVSDRMMLAGDSVIRAQFPGPVGESAVGDSRSEGAAIRQTLVARTEKTPGRLVFVIDGTEGVDASASMASALAGLGGTEVAVILAADGWKEVLAPTRGDDAALKKAGAQIRKHSAKGGHDNIPALLKAWDLAAEAQNGTIIWIHGPQPVAFATDERLRQRFERSSSPPQLISLATEVGPNRVLEKLDGFNAVKSEIRLGTLSEDLERLIKRCKGELPEFQLVRERAKKATDVTPGADTVASHVARLWAADEVQRMIGKRKAQDATQLANKYQLVTPVSGAVVLETQQQYTQAGLTPVPVESVPAVPEPSAPLLLVVAAILLVLRRRRALSLPARS